MEQKYETDSTVYNWYFDIDTSDLKCQELKVFRWNYMDGMQWQVMDEYMLVQETFVQYFKFFRKKKTNFLRKPGYLISSDKRYAKILLVTEMLKGFGYILEKDSNHTCSDGTHKAVITAKAEYDRLSEEYPELIVKSFGEFKPEENNSGWLWS